MAAEPPSGRWRRAARRGARRALLLVALATVPQGLAAAEEQGDTTRPGTPTPHAEPRPSEATVDRIRELAKEIEGLLATLPAERRDELLEELARLSTTRSVSQTTAGPEGETTVAAASGGAEPGRSASPQPQEPASPVLAERHETPAPGEPAPKPATPGEDLPELATAPLPLPAESGPVDATSAGGTEVESAAAPAELALTTGGCTTLLALDTNGDGQVDAVDRYWRYLRLWRDDDGDGVVAEDEVERLFDEGIRALPLRLDVFLRGGDEIGAIHQGRHLVLDLAANGFGDGRDRDDAVLAIDATALARGDGPRLVDADGTQLSGVQPFTAGWRVVLADASSYEISCPR